MNVNFKSFSLRGTSLTAECVGDCTNVYFNNDEIKNEFCKIIDEDCEQVYFIVFDDGDIYLNGVLKEPKDNGNRIVEYIKCDVKETNKLLSLTHEEREILYKLSALLLENIFDKGVNDTTMSIAV